MTDIRLFAPADMDEALDLVIAVWTPVFAGMRAALPAYVYDSFWPDGWEERQRREVSALLGATDHVAWVATENDTLCGLVIATAHEEDQMGEIVLIGVHPDHQRKGIGRALDRTAIAWMREAGMAFAMAETGADDGHAPARSAYEALGFEPWNVVRYVKKL